MGSRDSDAESVPENAGALEIRDLVRFTSSVSSLNRRIVNRVEPDPDRKFKGYVWAEYEGCDEPHIQMINQDYLGVSMEPALRRAAIRHLEHSGYGRNTNTIYGGSTVQHAALERAICTLFRTEMTILMNSCAAVNHNCIPFLCPEGGYILSDALSHNTVITGCRLSKATKLVFKHNDMADLERALSALPIESRKLIVGDGLYSMDAELWKLDEIVRLAEKYGAIVYVDDAHGTGTVGKNGLGTHEHFGIDLAKKANVVIASAMSKAIQSTGGFITGPKALLAPIPVKTAAIFQGIPVGAAVSVALESFSMLASGIHDRLHALYANTRMMADGLRAMGYPVAYNTGPFVVIAIGDEIAARTLVEGMFRLGVHIGGAVFPVVPIGKAVARMMLTAAMKKEEIQLALDKFSIMAEQLGISPP